MTIHRNTADGTASLYFPDGPLLMTAEILRNGVVVASGLSAAPEEDTYTIVVPFSATEYDADLVINWKNGPSLVRTTREEVVTPIVPLTYIANVAVKYGDALPTEGLMRVESLVRNIIESYTGQFFGLYLGTKEIKASGDPYLALPMPLLEYTSVIQNNYAAIDLTSGIRTTPDGWYLVRPSGYLEIKEAPPEEYITYGVIFAPPIGGLGFYSGAYYAVAGKWGYYNVPEPVLRAAELLVEDYLCPEVSYLDNYAKAITAADWRADWHEFRFSGTGNSRADALLKPYINVSMVVI